MTKIKKNVIIILIMVLIVAISCGTLIYFLVDPKPKQDYSGFKDSKLKETNIKLPENWQVEEIESILCIYEKTNDESKIYFVLGSVVGHGGISSKIFIHPFFGRIELHKEINFWSYGNLGQGMYRGEFTIENGETIELFTISYSQNDFYLLSYYPIEESTAVKIFYSIY